MTHNLINEATAWDWLLKLPRLPYAEYSSKELDNQLLVHVVPGVLGANQGAPYVIVSYRALNGKRYKGTGNNLYSAAENIEYKLRGALDMKDVAFLAVTAIDMQRSMSGKIKTG